MISLSSALSRKLLAATALSLSLSAAPLAAETLFTPSADGFTGQVRAASPERGTPILAGGKAVISGQGLVAGQELTLMRGAKTLNDAPIIVDGEGKFTFELAIDAEAHTGLQPIVVIAENPAAATVVDLKISPDVALSGAERFDILSEKVAPGLYQVAYSKASDALFVTAASGRPPVKDSRLVKIDPMTLKVIAEATPPEAPAPEPRGGQAPAPAGGEAPKDDGRPPVFAVYGVGVDDANGTVWTTNTRQNTVAVYKQSDLTLIKQFSPEAVQHARDVVVDEQNGRVYVGATGTGNIEVFDARTLEQLAPITLTSLQRGGEFSVMSLDIDVEHGKLATVSMTTDEVALVDLKTGETVIHPLKGAKSASGIAYDVADNLLFIASQNTDNLLIVDASTGEVKADVEVGAGALNIAFDPVSRQAFVANRGAGTITVVNTKGEITANLDAGSLPNHLRADGKGNVFAVNKSRGEDDPSGDRIWRIAPKAE